MSIAVFKKATVLGLTRRKVELLTALQELGCLHLIAINGPSKGALTTVSTTLLDKIKISLRYLKESPMQGVPRLFWREAQPNQIVEQILANQSALKECMEREEFLIHRIRDLCEWGHFVLPPEGDLAGIKLWFYKIPLKELPLIPIELPVQELHRSNRFTFVALCALEEPDDEKLSRYRVHTGSVALHHLMDEQESLHEQIEDLIDERRSLTRYHYLLSKEIAGFADRSELHQASDKLQLHGEFFVLQGWIPVAQVLALQLFCKQEGLGLSLESPLAQELPPTLLESAPWLQSGQELVNFYQTPGYHALDPSLMVFFSFSLFFAMILADAGYGLMLALGTLFFWKRLGQSKSVLWLRPLLVISSLFSILYGVLLGSYWGIEPNPANLLGKLHLLNIHNFHVMMALVITIGCVHIAIGCAMRSWFAVAWHEKIQALGFIFLIISALLYVAGLMLSKASLICSGKVLFVISTALIMIFASNEPVVGFKSFFKRIVHGIGAFAELPSLFGDILSYLRLFALGLAGASLAITFNSMAHHLAETSFVLAVLVLLLGQAMNFVLCLMSAVIHGLRLNYIEFFKWSIKEDGYSYQPFKKQEITHE